MFLTNSSDVILMILGIKAENPLNDIKKSVFVIQTVPFLWVGRALLRIIK